MTKNLIILLLVSVLSVEGLSQSKQGSKSVQLIELTEKPLVMAIRAFIMRCNAEIKSFDRRGFVTLHIDIQSRNDTTRSYFLSYGCFDVLEDQTPSKPDFYAIVDERLILIWIESFKEFATVQNTRKENVKFRKTLEKWLYPRQRLGPALKGENVNIRYYRESYMALDFGAHYYLLESGELIGPFRDY